MSDVHAPLLKHIQTGVVTALESSGCRGVLAEAISAGVLPTPMLFRSHGGGAAAIAKGQLKIDVAFLGASVADAFGNAAEPMPDHYRMALLLHFVEVWGMLRSMHDMPSRPSSSPIACALPMCGSGISESDVDWVVLVDSIGDSKKISRCHSLQPRPRDLLIARKAAQVILHSGLLLQRLFFADRNGGLRCRHSLLRE